jgi:hypothetical protein
MGGVFLMAEQDKGKEEVEEVEKVVKEAGLAVPENKKQRKWSL